MFGLTFFAPLVSAASKGDLEQFRTFLETQEASLTALRIWPIVQKLSMVIYRNVSISYITLISLFLSRFCTDVIDTNYSK